MGTSRTVIPKISRGLAGIILVGFFAGTVAFFGAVRYAAKHSRFRRCLAAAIYGARYLDDRGVLRQHFSYDCGPASLAMVLADAGQHVREDVLLNAAHTGPHGTTMLNLQHTAVAFGIDAKSWQLTYDDLECVSKPVIAFVSNDHFLVVDDVTESHVTVRDPAHGRLAFPAWIFNRYWHGQTIVFGNGKLPCSVPNQASSGNRGGIREINR